MNGFNINLQNSSALLCKLLNYTALLFYALVPTVHILASIDRLLISSQNVDTRLYSSKRLAYFMTGISTLVWAIFSVHALVRVNIQQLGVDYFVCTYDQSKLYLYFVNYSLGIFNCLFCLSMVILSVLSFKNVRRIRAVPRQQRKEVRSMTKKDFQLLRCLFVDIIVYICISICPSSFSIYDLATASRERTPRQTAVNNFINNLLTFVYFTFYCTSFFIFVGVSKAFRQELKRSIWKILGKNLVALREEENKPELDVQNANAVIS
jgi:hypothetical protein